MKFGKQLDCLALSNFRGYYIQYKELKKALKVFTGQERNQSTVQEVTHWTSSFLRLGPNPEVPPEARLNEILNKELDRVSKFTELEEDALRTQLDRLLDDCNKEDSDLQELRQRLDDLGDQIVHLKSFSQLNFTGFRKILKKYDKWSASMVMPWFMAQVMRTPLMNVDYDRLLGTLGSIATALRPAEQLPEDPGSPGKASPKGSFDLQGFREQVFFVDTKDTMRVRVQLAKHLPSASVSAAGAAVAASGPRPGGGPGSSGPPPAPTAPGAPMQQRPRTVEVFFDTADLSVYCSHATGVSVGGSENEGTAKPLPGASLLLRHSDGDLVNVVYEAGGDAFPTEVALTRGEASRLVRGEAVEPLLPPEAPAREALAAAGRAVRAHPPQRPVAQASYVRSCYREGPTGIIAVLDEDVRIARVQDWDGPKEGADFFPYNLLSVSFAPGTEARETPRWLRRINERATIFQVSGFSKAAHTVGHFCAKERGLPMPHWYRSIMNSNALGADQSEEALEQQGSDTPPAPQVAELSPAAVSSGASEQGGVRLVQELGGAPEAQGSPGAPPQQQRAASFAEPAADTGSLSAPLLGGPGAGQEAGGRGGEGASGGARPAGALSWLSHALGYPEQWEDKAKGAEAAEPIELPARLAIVQVQPKTLYSNERTFLEWIHFSVLFAGLGIIMLHGADEPVGVALGRFFVLMGIFFVGWSLHTFNRRAESLDRKEITAYEDHVAPVTLISALLVALLLSSLNAVGMLQL